MLSVGLLQDLTTTGGLIHLIVWVLLLGVLLWAVRIFLRRTQLDAEIQNIAIVIVALLLILFMVTRMGGFNL